MALNIITLSTNAKYVKTVQFSLNCRSTAKEIKEDIVTVVKKENKWGMILYLNYRITSW